MKLLTRDQFREAVFARDKYKCLGCGARAEDAHHITERKLFPDGGYYIENGASVCGPCHLKAEATILSCDELRQKAGIKDVVLPPGFDPALSFDKWGNVINADGTRTPGPMFHEPGVQKIMKPVLYLFGHD